MSEALYLLDSNILIYILQGRPAILRERVEAHAPGALVTSVICYAEVLHGVRTPDQAKALDALVQRIAVLPLGTDAARHYARLPFRRTRFDRLIAAQALAAGLTIVTANHSDFADVPGLRVENWISPE